MNALKTMKLMEKYTHCACCGSDKIGAGAGSLIVEDDTFTRSCACGWTIAVDEDDTEIITGDSGQLVVGLTVKHTSRQLREATFVGYTKTGRARVKHNAYAPYGVMIVVDTFSAKNLYQRRQS